MPEPWRLYYDSDCKLCRACERRAVSWASRAGVELLTIPLSSEEAFSKGYGRALVLEADEVSYAEAAWLELLGLAPWPLRALALVRRVRSGRVFARLIYNLVASNRSCTVRSR